MMNSDGEFCVRTLKMPRERAPCDVVGHTVKRAAAALVGVVLAWRVASEIEAERRSAPGVVVTQVDGTRIGVSRATVAAAEPVRGGDAPQRVGRTRRAAGLAIAAMLVASAAVGVALTAYAVANPFGGRGWTAALGGLLLVLACERVASALRRPG